ncbi:MAG TPA: GNAT family N-acetyltransferase, partial [Pyrinomonadaceae bacterium]|nr:GNAT family N-acetyltransferase [Pyrinomonadaceae bacterium]
MAYGWEGEKVRLVPLDRERHAANAQAWANDPDLTETILGGDFPFSRAAEDEWFDKMCATPGQHPSDVVFAVETLTGEHLGLCGIHEINYRHGSAVTGTIIGPHEARGKGYGADAARVRTRYCFEVLGLRMLISHVFAENEASLRMLARAGYKEVARLPRRY